MAVREFAHSLIYSTETLIFSILALLLLAYYRGFGRTYVKYWLFSLTALAVNQLSLALESTLSQQNIGSLIDTSLALIRQISQYFHFLFLMLGIYSATKKAPINPRVLIIGVLVVITLSCIAVLPYGFDSANVFNRFYLRESLAAFIFGCGFIVAACYTPLM